MTNDSWDALIIGAGPAGLSVALMLGRSRRRVLVVDAGQPRNRFAAAMHGVLGNDGRSPAELRERGREEAAQYGVEFRDDAVASVRRDGEHVAVVTTTGVHRARALVLATGVSDVLPAIPGLAEHWGTAVLHCPYCHGWEVKDRRLGVLATSPMSMHQAGLVRQLSDEVTVFTADAGDIAPEAQARLAARGIRLEPTRVVEVVGDGATLRTVLLEDGRELAIDALFTGGTLRPHDHVLADLDLARSVSPMGDFLAVDELGRTSDARIWAVGNVVNAKANVPMAMGAGSTTGAAVNAALVEWDLDRAVAGQG